MFSWFGTSVFVPSILFNVCMAIFRPYLDVFLIAFRWLLILDDLFQKIKNLKHPHIQNKIIMNDLQVVSFEFISTSILFNK